MPGYFKSMQWNACVHRQDLGLYSHPEEIGGNGVRNHVFSKRKNPLYQRLKGGSNLQRCIMQDSESNTLLMELSWPLSPPVKGCLTGLVVKTSTSGVEDPGFKSRLRRDFSGSNHNSGLKIGTPEATLPGAWHYRVSAGTGRPSVSTL